MYRFSHTALKNKEENNSVVAVFTNKAETTGLTANFNAKGSPSARKGDMRMTLRQLDFLLATANDSEMTGTLREGRKHLVQRQRYEEHKLSAPAAEVTEAAI
jgi:hypothetical protein